MNRRFRAKIAAFSFIAISGFFSAGFSGGLWLYELGTPETGTAGAGFSARAQDAATAWGNPAGMTRLDSLNYLGGGMIYNFTNKFSIDSATYGGGGGGNAGGTWPYYGLYYVNQPLAKNFPKLRSGLNTNSYIREIVDYEDTWAGRYYTQKAQLLTYHSNTVVAYPITPWFSIGAGWNTIYAKLYQRSAVNNLLDPGTGDGQIQVEAYNSSFGGNGGILISPLPNLRFGATYRSPIKLRFRNALAIRNVGFNLADTLLRRGILGKQYDLDIRIPQEVTAGFYMDLTDQIAIMADFNWQNWHGFQQFEIDVSDTASSLIRRPNLNNTYHGAFGVHVRPIPLLLLKTGFSFDTSPISKSDRTPTFPVDRQFRYAGGIEFYITHWLQIGVDYEYVGLGSAPIDQHRGPFTGTLVGQYSTNRLNVANLYVKGRL